MTTKRFKAAVIGGSGYGGAELIRRLLLHPQVELVLGSPSKSISSASRSRPFTRTSKGAPI